MKTHYLNPGWRLDFQSDVEYEKRVEEVAARESLGPTLACHTLDSSFHDQPNQGQRRVNCYNAGREV